MTRPSKALFQQVDDQISQVKGQVGQGQELDNLHTQNFTICSILNKLSRFVFLIKELKFHLSSHMESFKVLVSSVIQVFSSIISRYMRSCFLTNVQ